MPDVSTPEALLAFVAAQPRQVGDLYAWGARRLYRPRMVRALVVDLVTSEQLAASDPVALADWSWVWHPEHASGPGTPPPLDLSPEALRVVDDEEPAEEPEEEDDRVLPALSEEEELDARERDRLRSARPREVRPAVIGVREDKHTRRLLSLVASDDPHPGGRPQTRAECVDGPRPCPYVSCRFNLYLDVEPNGVVRLNFPDLEAEEMKESCALDVADRGALSVDHIAPLMNITHTCVWQIEVRAVTRLLKNAKGFVDLRSLIDSDPKEKAPAKRQGQRAPRVQRERPAPRHDRLLEIMGEREWTFAELRETSGILSGALGTQLGELLIMGLVERLGRGRYRALPRREEAAE